MTDQRVVAAIDQGTTSDPVHRLRPRRAGWCRSPSANTGSTSPSPAGSSTTPPRSGATCGGWCPRRCGGAGCDTSDRSSPSASPTSARPRWCGTAAPACRSAGPSSGRTPGPARVVDELRGPASRRLPRSLRAAAGRPTSPRPACAGCSTTSPACGSAPSAGEVLFGTMETWLIWNLTGGPAAHVTDVTNASRTMLMDLRTLHWDDELLAIFDIPRRCCRRSAPSAEVLRHGTARAAGRADRGRARRPAGRAVRPDLLRARRGQVHLRHRRFLLLNTGTEPVRLEHGLLTTVGYQLGDEPPVVRPGGLDRHHRLAGAVVPRPARADRQRAARSRRWPAPSTTTAAATSSPPSPACSPRTGAARRAASSSA